MQLSDFYGNTLLSLLNLGQIRKDSKILVVCGGTLDRDVLANHGFVDVVISNLDTRTQPDAFAPFGWSLQDAEQLGYEDDSFDFVIEHNGLHHCRSPHAGLLEMYRVAREGILVFEPLDNLTTRLGMQLGLGQEYEIAAVAGNDFRFGGVRNSEIPNFVYRFTEREVVKTISTYAPHTKDKFRFFYALRLPWDQLRMRKNKLRFVIVMLAYPFIKAMTTMFRRENNNFAFAVLKSSPSHAVHPWLEVNDGKVILNRKWVQEVYRP